MKRTGIDHPKTKRLARLLGVTHFSAVGILECVWHFTARHALRGDIGRWSNEEIADSVGWPAEDAERLVTALLDAGWFDRHSQHRLTVHHWHDHCDESTKKTAKKYGWQFVSRGVKDSVPESFPNIPEQFANGSEQLSTVPDSQSRSQSQAKATATANADWQAVEAEISRLDIGEAVPLMHDARQRGYQPAELRSIIAYREQHREELGVGALVYRIRNSPPGTLIDKGWPRPTKKAPQDFSRLESTYGTLVAGMKAKELSDAMQRAGILATDSNVAACREPGSTIRNQLLVQIDADASLL